MLTLRKLIIVISLAAGFVGNTAVASYLDFTDSDTISDLDGISGGFEGIIDGIGFTLTSSDGTVNFNEGYDGAASNAGCQANGGPLACDTDGAGLDNDEITGLTTNSGQVLTLQFASAVLLSGFDFLDLYLNPDSALGGEQVRVSIDGGAAYTVDASGSSGDGGYASLDLLMLGGPTMGQTIEFTAFQGLGLQDDRNNDYAFAGVSISAVPVPAAVWLFGTAIIGLFGIRRWRA